MSRNHPFAMVCEIAKKVYARDLYEKESNHGRYCWTIIKLKGERTNY